jgi:hypothetical protein
MAAADPRRGGHDQDANEHVKALHVSSEKKRAMRFILKTLRSLFMNIMFQIL